MVTPNSVRHTRALPAALLLATVWSASIGAQGVTTAGIRGTVSAPSRRDVDARVLVRNEATGYATESRLTNGRFFIQGLEPGGPYTVTARALGFVPRRVERVGLALGEMREIDFILEPVTPRLDDIVVVAQENDAGRRGRADGGTGAMISRSTLERLPTLNRDLYDFVRLVPQVSTKIGLANPGMSAGGAGFRSNNFLINGVSERTLSGGVSNAFGGVRSIPLDAVQEYQVLIAPYDVRYGDFTGALVNTVTRSGTNTFHGSAFAYGRTDWLGRDTSAASSSYERVQYGFSLGGPIVRNRLHFFVAPEVQHYRYPAPGPYVGQPANAARPVPVSGADLTRFDALMRNYGLTAGSAGPVENESPLRNIFARVDMAIPEWNGRVLAWHNYSESDDAVLSRSAPQEFPLSSHGIGRDAAVNTSTLQLHTALRRGGGAHNEVLISRRSERLLTRGFVEQPIVRVTVPARSGGRISLTTGTNESAQGSGIRSSAFSVRDNLTLPLGARHLLTLGAEGEWFRVRRGSSAGSYGRWSFASLDDFARGIADQYELRMDFGNDDTELGGAQYAAYVGDEWRPTERMSLTAGVRADLLALGDHAPYHRGVDSAFGRRTDRSPKRRAEISPRIGFTWDLDHVGRQRLRGGGGVFTGRYPLAWAHTTLSSYGVGGLLRCNVRGAAASYPPPFPPDPRAPPTSCLGGTTLTTATPGDVDLLDPDLRMYRAARGSIAYERRLPWDLLVTSEALFTRTLSDVVFVNLNLQGARATDAHGRVLYGTVGPTGIGSPSQRSTFGEVIDLRNTNRGHSYQLSARIETTRAQRSGGFASYTFSRTRDVQTPLRVNARGIAAWGVARTMSGRHEDLETGISSNDVPHRVVLAGTYVAPWTRARTELSFYYVGESGRPFAYTAFGTSLRGDLNADGAQNDPVYVPRDALDASEMAFSGVSEVAGDDDSPAAQADRERAQRAAFQQLIDRSSCLRAQRGHIMERNSCREPWSNTTIASLRQAIPIAGRAVDVQLDVFNVLNLLNDGWGLRRNALPALLEHVGQTTEPASSRPVFRFDATRPAWDTQSSESAFQLQVALRYRF